MTARLRPLSLTGFLAVLCVVWAGQAEAQEHLGEAPEVAAASPDAPSPAALSPEDVERARNHFNVGVAYYEEERYESAAREFSEAHQLTHHPDVLYNLASCYDQMERHELATETYRRYLRDHPDPPDRSRIERRIRELEALANPVVQNTQDGTPPPEYTPVSPTDDEESPAMLITALSLMSVGLGVGIVGGVYWAGAQRQHDRLQDCEDMPATCENVDIGALKEDGDSSRTTGNVLFAGGAGIFGVGAALLIIDLLTGPDDPPSPLTVAPGPGEFGLALSGEI